VQKERYTAHAILHSLISSRTRSYALCLIAFNNLQVPTLVAALGSNSQAALKKR